MATAHDHKPHESQSERRAPAARARPRPAHPLLAHPLLALQRSAGNQSVLASLQRIYVETEAADGQGYVQAGETKIFYKWVADKTINMADYEVSPAKTGWWFRNLYRRKTASASGEAPASGNGAGPGQEGAGPQASGEVESGEETALKTGGEPSGEKVASGEEAPKGGEPSGEKPSAVKVGGEQAPKDGEPSGEKVGGEEAAKTGGEPSSVKVGGEPLAKVLAGGEQSTEAVGEPSAKGDSGEKPSSPKMEKRPPKKKFVPKSRTRKPSGKKSGSGSSKGPVAKPTLPPGKTASQLETEFDRLVVKLQKGIDEFAEYLSSLSVKKYRDEARKDLALLQKDSSLLDAQADAIADRKTTVDAELDTTEDLEAMGLLGEEAQELQKLYPKAMGESFKMSDAVAELQGLVDIAESAEHDSKELVRLRKLWASEALARGHFVKHKSDTGYATEADYLARAEDLVTKSAATVDSKVRSDGDTLFFDNANGDFAIKSKYGKIRTLFRPSRGHTYYDDQS